MNQETFTDIEYSLKGKRGRPPMGMEKMPRMYLLPIWFNLTTLFYLRIGSYYRRGIWL